MYHFYCKFCTANLLDDAFHLSLLDDFSCVCTILLPCEKEGDSVQRACVLAAILYGERTNLHCAKNAASLCRVFLGLSV